MSSVGRILGRSIKTIGRTLDRYDRSIKAACLIIGVLGVLIGTSATLTNNQQQADFRAEQSLRNREQASVQTAQQKLLDCFDEYAAASSTSSKAVRRASIKKDAATAARDDALNAEGIAFQRLVQHILSKTVTPHDVKALSDTLDARSHAAHQLDVAQDALDKAREDNPVPPPPSVFCANE